MYQAQALGYESCIDMFSFGLTYFFFTSFVIWLNNVKHYLVMWLFWSWSCGSSVLTHWGRVTHICVSTLTIIGSDNGLAPGRCQTIIRTNAGILLIRPLGTNFSEILIEILIFSFKKMRLKVSSAKRRPFCLGLNVLSIPVLLWPILLRKWTQVELQTVGPWEFGWA